MGQGRLEFNTFVKGIITEAGPLTYPEGASLDEANFVLNRDGSRQRRFGIAFEKDAELRPVLNIEGGAVTSHRWHNPDNLGDLEVVVFQDGGRLTFFNSNADAVSAAPLNLGAVLILEGWEDNVVASTASISGKFYIAGNTDKVIELSYDLDLDQVTQRPIDLHMRDLWGVQDDLEVDERPGTLTNLHEYNLRNQGWPDMFPCASTAAGAGTLDRDPIEYATTDTGLYPSNADQLHLFKMESAEDAASVATFSPWDMTKSLEGTSEAPKGTHILKDVWNRGAAREVESGITMLPLDKNTGVIGSVAAYAGRLFYSFQTASKAELDDNSPILSSIIAFSQVGVENAHKCYSVNDQSAETFNDVLETDGGFIVIPDVGRVYELVNLADSLFVIASNGVWEIHGGEGSFSAKSQSQSKVTSVGGISRTTILPVEDGITYWGKGGIYSISVDDVSLRGKASNMTQETIQSLYDDIPSKAKRSSRSIYDAVSRQLRWLYRSEELVNQSLFNRELIFDMNLKAFYKNEFVPLNEVDRHAYPVGYVDVPDVLILDTSEPVTVDGVPVTDNGIGVTSQGLSVEESVRGSTKYVGAFYDDLNDWRYTFFQLSNTDFRDWVSTGVGGEFLGVDSPARLLTGHWTGGTSTMDKRIPYIWTHFRRTEQGFVDLGGDGYDAIGHSGCIIQAQWEWCDTAASGKFGTQFQAYKLPRVYTPATVLDPMDYGFTVVTTKNKVRGSGNALSLNFTSEPGKDCHIYGWALEVLQEDS
jgi:hypothetical protein